MTEAILDWPAIMAAVKGELESVTNSAGQPAFQSVGIGEPLGLPLGGPHCFAWYIGRSNAVTSSGARGTLGNIMYSAHIQVGVFWLRQAERETLEVFDADIATIDTNIRRRFRANSTINNDVTDLDITDSQVGFGPSPGISPTIQYRTLMFELVLDNLEGEAIVP